MSRGGNTHTYTHTLTHVYTHICAHVHTHTYTHIYTINQAIVFVESHVKMGLTHTP